MARQMAEPAQTVPIPLLATGTALIWALGRRLQEIVGKNSKKIDPK
ncbi:MAG: hypothetical protein P8N43_01615 [Alphaproteobacteria bacterium]|nr:hypothetical protein [Alphaproteobacteria bacterium]